MTAVDRAWLLMEQPVSPMMIVGMFVLSQPLEYQRLCDLVTERFLAFDRFRCRPQADALGARWVRQAGFDVTDHVVRVALPGGAGQKELEALVGELAGSALSMQRPLWSFHLVENYRGGSALIVRVHHCYADGIAMVRVVLSLTDAERNHRRAVAAQTVHAPDGSIAGFIAKTLDDAAGLIGDAAGLVGKGIHYALHPGEISGLGGELARIAMLPDEPRTSLKGALSGVRHVAWSEPFDFEEVRTLGRVLGCTINDVLVATLAGALGRYLDAHSDVVPGGTIRAAVPVNLRTGDQIPITLGNQFGLVFLELPVSLRHPLERLYAVRTTMQKLKGSPQALLTLGVLAVVGSLPAAMEEPVMAMFGAKASLVVSNVPGPREQLFFAGAPVSQALFWVPQAGDIGIGVSILTYNGGVQFGVMADRALIPEPGELVRLMGEEFERLVLLVLLGAGTLGAGTLGD